VDYFHLIPRHSPWGWVKPRKPLFIISGRVTRQRFELSTYWICLKYYRHTNLLGNFLFLWNESGDVDPVPFSMYQVCKEWKYAKEIDEHSLTAAGSTVLISKSVQWQHVNTCSIVRICTSRCFLPSQLSLSHRPIYAMRCRYRSSSPLMQRINNV